MHQSMETPTIPPHGPPRGIPRDLKIIKFKSPQYLPSNPLVISQYFTVQIGQIPHPWGFKSTYCPLVLPGRGIVGVCIDRCIKLPCSLDCILAVLLSSLYQLGFLTRCARISQMKSTTLNYIIKITFISPFMSGKIYEHTQHKVSSDLNCSFTFPVPLCTFVIYVYCTFCLIVIIIFTVNSNVFVQSLFPLSKYYVIIILISYTYSLSVRT